MKTLFLDLASHSGFLACVTKDDILAFQEVDHRISDAELIPAIEKLLAEAQWKYGDLTHIACVTGPGGFTSLRVAVAYANILADQRGIPLTGIHLSDLYRARVQDVEVFWLHSTKKEELFIRGGEWKEPTLISLSEASTLPPSLRWMGELIPHHREKFSAAVEADLAPLNTVLPAYLQGLDYHRGIVHPWYGRSW